MADATKLYTLTEVAKRTSISMPTLQRYKKLYQSRIPSKGTGRSQRYPEASLAVFLELKKENIGKRGRPRKNAAAAAAKPAAKRAPAKRGRKPAAAAPAAKPTGELLTLTQVAKLTGISYPTLLRYVKLNLALIPHRGTGRARRFLPEAVAVFRTLRGQSRRGRKASTTKAAPKAPGRKPAAAATGRRGRPPAVVDPAVLTARVKELEQSQKRLERLVTKLQKRVDKPYRVVLQRK